MLSKADNEAITRVGPGTPMHRLQRRFWHPVSKLATLEAGGGPKRVRLLGENYIAWRAGDGRIGFFADRCPHRGVSLALARNDDCALTCIFHGWKIDVSGAVVDIPSEPGGAERLANKVRVRHYPTREAGGLLWAYLGEGEPTQFPQFEWMALPAAHVTILEIPVDCNWVQGAEGLLDSSHVSSLHASTLDTVYLRNDGGAALTKKLFMADRSPKYEVNQTTYGMQAAAIRRVGEGQCFARVSEFVMPSWTLIPQPDDEDFLMMYQLPVDDEHTIQWYVMYNMHHPIDDMGIGHGFQSMLDYDGSSFHANASAANLWTQDRELQRRGHRTGFRNVLYEDLAVIEALGPIADRSEESLGASDAAITRFRRILLDALRDDANGKPVRALDGKVDYARIRARQVVYPESVDWKDAIRAGVPAS
jgi:phthalate 4,5-dioxygenase oxygenase subunit